MHKKIKWGIIAAKPTSTIWRCNDTSIQDMPLRDISGTKVKAYSEFQYYSAYDDNDSYMISLQGIKTDEQNTPGNVEIRRDNSFRIKHIRVRGSLVEVLSKISEMDYKL